MIENAHQRFDDFITKQLNNEQKKAVTSIDGTILVIAGAGSGKTRIITARILNLILNHNVAPHHIVALTFTNRAAKEMRDRVASFLDTSQTLPWIGTFHAYCLHVLKQHHHLIDMPYFSILDDDDQQKMLKAILKRHNLTKELTPKELSRQISRLKNHILDTEKTAQCYAMNPWLHELHQTYEHEKRISKCLDFDDLLIYARNLFIKNSTFKQQHQERITHILVDEYQDTNHVQHDLLKQMTKKNARTLGVDSVCIVGDEDQSIYSWRGATITNILAIQRDFPKTSVIKVEQNYRSADPILRTANAVIHHNRQRNPKRLWSTKKGTDRIRVIACMSEYQEADLIACTCKLLKKQHPKKSIGILYRTHMQSRALEEALLKQSLPYRIIGGIQFYERKEVKDILAYARLVVNPFDHAAFFRIINTPQRGLGEKFEEYFRSQWHSEPLSTFHDIAQHLIKNNCLTKTKTQSLHDFLKLFNELTPSTKPSDVFEQIVLRTGYLATIKATYDRDNAQERTENIKELINAARHAEKTANTTLEHFLHEVSLMQENISKKKNDPHAITLMTFHAAKGLEFDTVVLAGLEDGIMPSIRDDYTSERLEEERRLFYVGITRAREHLLLTYARYRYQYRNMSDQVASRFLDELPKKESVHEDASFWKKTQTEAYIAQWLKLSLHTTYTSSPIMTFPAQKPRPLEKKHQKNSAQTQLKGKKTYKKNQPIKHAQFGMGIIQSVEKKNNGATFVTIKFKSGIKKIDAAFLNII